MKDIRITHLEPKEIDKIGELLDTRDDLEPGGAERRKRQLEWLAFRNPDADGEPTYYIAQHGEKIVAHLGRMPSEFVVNGKIRRGYFIHDLYVHPSFRKMGMGLFLAMKLYETIEDNSPSFCCLVWTSPLNLAMQRHRKYHELWAGRYVKLIKPDEKLTKFIKSKRLASIVKPVLRVALHVANYLAFALSFSNIEVVRIERFDKRFDDFSERLRSRTGVCSFKRSNYLNWKFIDRPYSKLEVFAAQQNGEILGFIVVGPNTKKEYPEGAIVDIMADPDDSSIIRALVKAAVSYFYEKNVYSIECCLTDKRFIKVFKRFLFVQAVNNEPMTLANLDKFKDSSFLINIDNWHLTYGDSDEFMLRP